MNRRRALSFSASGLRSAPLWTSPTSSSQSLASSVTSADCSPSRPPFRTTGMRSALYFSSSSYSGESLHQPGSSGDERERATQPTGRARASSENELRTPASPSVNAAFFAQSRGRGLGRDRREDSLAVAGVPAPPERPFPSSVPTGNDSEGTSARYDTPSELLDRLDSHRHIASTVKPLARMVTPVLTSPVPACDLPSSSIARSSVDVGASMEGPAGDVRGLSSPGKSAHDGALTINKPEGSHESVHAARNALMKSELARLLRLYVHRVSGFRHFFHGYTVNASTDDVVDGQTDGHRSCEASCCVRVDDNEPLWLTRVKEMIDKKPYEKAYLENVFLQNYGQTLPPKWTELLKDEEYMRLSTNGKIYIYKRSILARGTC